MQRSNARFVERLPLVLNRPVYAYALTLSFCGLALLLRFAAEPLLPDGYPFVTFFPAVILASFLFGVCSPQSCAPPPPGISSSPPATVSSSIRAWRLR